MRRLILLLFLLMILISGCGPTAEEQTATSSALTATEATPTPTITITPTDTPQPTFTETPLPTFTPTITATPDPADFVDTCVLVSLSPVSGASAPSYRYKAEGFIPFEFLAVKLMSSGSGTMNFELARSDGSIEGTIGWELGPPYPTKMMFGISGDVCDIKETVTWP